MIFAWLGFTRARRAASFFCSSGFFPATYFSALRATCSGFAARFDKRLHACQKRRVAAFQIAPVDFGEIDNLLLRPHQSEPLLILACKGDKSHGSSE